jgi:hypothetical protein
MGLWWGKTSWQEGVVETKLLTSWQPRSRDRKELGTKYTLQDNVPNDLLPPMRSHLLKFLPSLNTSLRYEPLPGPVAQAYTPSYLGDGDWENGGSKPRLDKKVLIPHLNQ